MCTCDSLNQPEAVGDLTCSLSGGRSSRRSSSRPQAARSSSTTQLCRTRVHDDLRSSLELCVHSCVNALCALRSQWRTCRSAAWATRASASITGATRSRRSRTRSPSSGRTRASSSPTRGITVQYILDCIILVDVSVLVLYSIPSLRSSLMILEHT